MSDFLDTLTSIATEIVSTVLDTASIVKDPAWQEYNAASRVFSTGGADGFKSYTLPKIKNSFVIEFQLTSFAKNFIEMQLTDTHGSFDVNNVSCFAYSTDLPSTSFTVDKLNQYNRTRYHTGAITYKPVTMSFYDTSDGAAYLLIDAYRKFYYGDFFRKYPYNFRNDVLSSAYEYEILGGNWGRSVMNNGNKNNQYFFKQINIYEIDNDTYTAHNMFNPIIEDVSMDTKSMDQATDPSIISLTLRYEGIGNLGPDNYPSIAYSTVEIGSLITDTDGMGRSGYFKYFGEMDDKSLGILTVGKIISAGTSLYSIVSSVGSLLSGDISADTIRNLGSAISSGASAIGLGDLVSSASESFGLGNILGDF